MRKWLVVSLAVSACANNVPQDRSTGPDGKLKGATPIVLSDNTANVKGIVTYPGGDRVDWKMIELPAGKKGTLDLTMTYSTPRKGLKVQFDVFDQWNVPVWQATKTKARSASIDKAAGKYWIRIYAPRRGDAGQYKLTVDFKEEVKLPDWDPRTLAISDPPKLPQVPEVADVPPPPPPGPTPPPPPPPDPDVVKPPPPPPPAKPVVARVLKVAVDGDALEITLGAGSETSGIGKEWKATFLRADTDKPLGNGAATVVRVNKTTTVIRIKMTPDLVNANPNVKLAPP